jgi:hypothetical protein
MFTNRLPRLTTNSVSPWHVCGHTRKVKGVEFVAHYAEIGSGHGGYNQDHEFFGYRQSI